MSWLGAALPGVYLLLTSTTNLVPGIWPYDAKRMLQFGLLALLFLLPVASRRVRTEFGQVMAAMPLWIGATLAAIFAWGALSALVNGRSGMHLANSLSEVALLGALVIGVFVIATCRRIGGRSFDRIAIGLLALTGLAVGAQELLGVAAAHAGGVDFNFRISLLHFSWPRFYNQVQSWMVPALAALPLLFNRSPLARVVCALVLGLQWYIILMTGARGSFVALTAAIAFAVLFLPTVRKPLIGWQLTGLVMGAALFILVLYGFEAGRTEAPQPGGVTQSQSGRAATPPPASGFYGNENETTSGFLAQSVGRPLLSPMGRTWMWKVTLRDATQHPWLGIGPMNYVCTSPEPIGHPHNFLLQLAAEWGIPVATAAGILCMALLWRLTASIRRQEYAERQDLVLAGLLLTGVLAAALHACVSGVMVMPASQVAGLLVVGLLLGMAPTARERKPPVNLLWPALTGLVLSAALLILGVQELSTLAQRSAQLRPGEDLRPRMWQDSKVCRLYSGPDEVNN